VKSSFELTLETSDTVSMSKGCRQAVSDYSILWWHRVGQEMYVLRGWRW